LPRQSQGRRSGKNQQEKMMEEMPGIEKQKPDLTIFHLVTWEFLLSGPIVIWPLLIVNVMLDYYVRKIT
jgi:hypothetical protein